jgi:serine/threonine protein kinase
MADEPKPQTQDVPSNIGEYNVLRILSSGVMGRTYLGNVGNAHIAIKIYFPDYAQKLDYAPKFKQEIVHPNIMQYKDIQYDNTWQHFFVMDYLEVRPISYKRLYGQGQRVVIGLFGQIADAIHFAHQQGIVHANLKPTNVLIRREGAGFMPIVSDFGIGYIYNEGYFTSRHNFKRVFPYMAPETIETFTSGGDVHSLPPTADIYSLTMVLCEVLSGKPIFDDLDTAGDLLDAKKKRKYRLVSVNYPARILDVRKLNEFINQCISYEPQARPPSMDKWKEGLMSCITVQAEEVQTK